MRPVPKSRHTFLAQYGAIKIRVRMLPTVEAITKIFRDDWIASNEEPPPEGTMIYSFFVMPLGRKQGIIYLTENSRLFELVPHEVYHAVCNHWTARKLEYDEEKIARALGCLTALILSRIDTGE